MYRSQNGMFIIDYNGMFEEHRNNLLVNSILSLRDDVAERRARGVLVSLKHAQASGRGGQLRHLTEKLDGLSRQCKVPIGYVDYDTALYPVLRSLTGKTRLKLFKNFSAARLFLDPKAFRQGLEVLVYDEDEENARTLGRELGRFGYRVVMARNAEEYAHLSAENRYEIILTQSSLNASVRGEKPNTPLLKLSKELIANLPLFMDTAVETLVSMTGLEAQKSSHTIRRFAQQFETQTLCAVMRFSGDIEGVFVLVFPIELACTAIEAILGEAVTADDLETLGDGVGEFCNIITGSSKALLSDKDVKVVFELPKTHHSLETTLEEIGGNNGVWIDMQLDGRPFYMFITR
jgi:CheY-specific phosphatase CheX